MLLEKIDKELKESIKSKNETKILTLRMLKSSIHNKEIEKKDQLKDEEIIEIIKKEIKKHKESIDMFKKGNREDLVDNETKEVIILEKYLPPQLSEDEIRKLVKEIIAKINAKDKKELGKVMKEIMLQLKGRADGKIVNRIVLEELSSPPAM